MKIYKYHFLIVFIFSLCAGIIQFTHIDRADVTYIGQFAILLIGIFNVKSKWTFRLSLWSLLFADFLYYILVYKLNLGTGDRSVVVYSSFLYLISFLLFALPLMHQSLTIFAKTIRRTSELFVSAFFIVIAGYYILVPGLLKFISSGPDFGHLSNIITLCSSLPLVIISYIFLTNDNKIKNQPTLVGFFILGVLDIGIQLETIKYGNLKFSSYDLFWLLGVFFISFGAKDFALEKETLKEQKSIVGLIKNMFFISALVSISVFSFLVKDNFEVSPMYFIFLTVSIFIFGIILSTLISRKISSYNETIKNLLVQPVETTIDTVVQNSPVEFSESIFAVYQNIIERNASELKTEKTRLLKTQDIYRQMAHDITSPLSVLHLISSKSQIDESANTLLQQATQRVRSIAEDILSKGHISKREIEKHQSIISLIDIKNMLKKLVEEKKIEFISKKQNIKMHIQFNDKDVSDQIKCHANEKELSRVFSNLLNNASEALPREYGGEILISAYKYESYLILRIKDNGTGFSNEVLNHKFDYPITMGKEAGHGIGLFGAVRTMQRWNGHLELKNEEGAVVHLKLKLVQSEASEEFIQLDKFLSDTHTE